jgi:hypothetical protein
MSSAHLLAPEAITLRIATVRGQRVLLDSDLAALYEVETKRFNKPSGATWRSFRPTSCSSSPPPSGRL